ncbi:asparaginase [Actinobacillus pleuropneumoniae]|uniref:L-asparaginase n=3 Tax=Actinobacillus pleuropneumoniae TaxID=715 RepID=B0BNT4_ACTPJ|nr:asparaginase [Actinobacillus pleuropneumoniae]ABN73760.1 probable L-asparaginase [Actinobacillus pleuropneumoniae serovar 5b str. L20]ABY69219.1 L-asparaginase [Actinobacillus pleuropneumoniae serovar 3 str. JL03]EFL81589.1 L-asparaginase [Actinobacillus pleuropneumoniae serovar 6 str. Femo]EFM92369.1 Asparaginase [Actinobacillus pleuropneumoniae serovar 6 str. Femo]MEE3682582.1 asparaginase [Actinobacillus pleuropneumoniae]
MTKKLLILHTGGTISMSEGEDGKVSPSEKNPLLAALERLNHPAQLSQESVLNVPSPHITLQHWLLLKTRIEKAVNEEQYDGIVITHGTDTLEETAYFLDLALNVNVPVAITGAMRSSNELGSDGLINLQSAILVALCPESRNKGVLVVMNDEIHNAKFVTKTHTTNVATFQTPTFGPCGLIAKNRVLYFQQLTEYERFPIQTVTRTNVQLVKAYAGMDSFLLEQLAHHGCNGVVIEALGAGNLPPSCLAGLDALLRADIPVVLVSRAFNGVTQDVYDYLGGGKQLKQQNVIFTTGLSGQKARIKLLVLLNQNLSKPLAEYF